MISFLCHCGQMIHVPPEMGGQQGQCPTCNSVLTVPESSEPPPPVLGPRMQTEDPPAAVSRICPACGETIKAVARKCRFCGEILDPSLLAARRVYGDERAAPVSGGSGRSPAYQPTSGLALSSLVCALCTVLTFGLTALPAVVLGHLALGKIKRGEAQGARMASIGLLLGYVVLAGIGLILLISLMA